MHGLSLYLLQAIGARMQASRLSNPRLSNQRLAP